MEYFIIFNKFIIYFIYCEIPAWIFCQISNQDVYFYIDKFYFPLYNVIISLAHTHIFPIVSLSLYYALSFYSLICVLSLDYFETAGTFNFSVN